MPKFEAPKKNYLERRLEPPLPDKEKHKTKQEHFEQHPESVRRLFNPNIEYGKSGKEKVELKDGWTLEYTYETLSEQEINSYSTSNEIPESLKQDIEAGKFRRLVGLSIDNPSGNELDLMKDFEVRDIFFAIDNKNFHSSLAKNKVFCYFSPNSFLGIMTLLHEIGHTTVVQKIISDSDTLGGALKGLGTAVKQSTARKIYNSPYLHFFLPQKLNEFAGKNVLKEERDAWAVAVSALRGTLDAFNVSKEDLRDSIHKMPLTAYSERIRQL
ncbi:MAG: hypothetical protein UU95_C0002G0023 [Parcubacteria group bacterium GW2011_GWC2_42_12]|nr:MAG: hypothetical protein UU43_C0005G0001 [Candidatus Falkowbacteria bacterium GW2011_GWA2_41_14]KKS35317.1 MAG: hypothetical protein UU95_C0002G0023 [Parcubacteria group bacterium GW2011_GWC2_42_12]